MEAQVELRQHIRRRNGITVWVGAANVFPEFEQIRWRKTLLNGGFGYRWAFKENVNVRLDGIYQKWDWLCVQHQRGVLMKNCEFDNKSVILQKYL